MKTLTIGTIGVSTSVLTEETLTQLNSVVTLAIQLTIAVITIIKLLKQKSK